MKFRSVADLNRDVATWAESFPQDVDLVVGIPRSGLLAATMLALHLHLPLTDLDGLLAGRVLGGGKRLEDRVGPDADLVGGARRILVVDDSVNRGGAIREAREKVAAVPGLAERVVWASPYVLPGAEHHVDLWFEKIPQPRAFEWNVLHHSGLVNACLDLDGVVAREPTREEDDGGPRYEAYLTDTPPRFVPGAEIGWLVTSRSERHRARTEAWLAEHGIRYRELLMAPPPERGRRAPDPARQKAAAYRRTKAWLFIESECDQAVRIADASGRPVYCTTERTMVYPRVPVGAPARRRDDLVWRAQDELRRQRTRAAAWRRRLTRALPGT